MGLNGETTTVARTGNLEKKRKNFARDDSAPIKNTFVFFELFRPPPTPIKTNMFSSNSKKTCTSYWGGGGRNIYEQRLKEGNCDSVDLGAELDTVIRGAGFMPHLCGPRATCCILFLHFRTFELRNLLFLFLMAEFILYRRILPTYEYMLWFFDK